MKESIASFEVSKASQAKSSQALKTSRFDGKNGGLLRSEMKFDYEYPQDVPTSNLPYNSNKLQTSQGSKSQKKVSGNLFSCMDNPKYERDFEIVPKVIRKY